MDYYQDIFVKPNTEMGLNVLLGKVYKKLHYALKEIRPYRIGVSFPNYQTTLGNSIRLHCCETDLANLHICDWLGELISSCQVSNKEATPKKGIKYRTVSRWQSNMSKSKLRRLVKRGSISGEEKQKYHSAMMMSQLTPLPYLVMKSGSTGQWHRRYFLMGDLTDVPTFGEFDSFGLSRQATIPWF